jgi:hypothetical protein
MFVDLRTDFGGPSAANRHRTINRISATIENINSDPVSDT